MNLRHVLVTGLFLFLFAVVGAALVALTHDKTAQRIHENEKAALLRNLHVIIPPERHDNDIFHDTIELDVPELSPDEPVVVYRARRDGWPVAAVFTVVAPDGYNGKIKLLVGVNLDGTVAGIRVISHKETPGLGDAIEADKSDWIEIFRGKSIGNPPLEQWKVKRDGGAFDQLTGATITPRAVVKVVRKTLLYFQAHRDEVFAAHPSGETQ